MICDRCNCEMIDGICPECKNVFDENMLTLVEEVSDDFDAEVIVSLLKSCGITAYKRYSGFSAVAKIYCGNSNLGVKIFVSDKDADKAKEIINAPFVEEEFDGGEVN